MTGTGTAMRRINSLIQARSRNTFARFLIDNSNFMSKSYNEALRMGKNRDIYLTMTELFVGMLRSITAVSYLYFPAIWFLELDASHFGGEICFAILTMWMVVEMLFFLLYYHQYVRFNDQRPRLKHKAKTRDARIEMLRTCFAAMSDGAEDQSPEGVVAHLRKTMEGWFLKVPLREVLYNNILQWTAFAFFSKELEDMSVDEIRDNRDIVRIIENDYLKFKFQPGYNRDAPGMRLNFDPLVVTQRPFVVYLFFVVVNWITSTVLHFLLGFSLRETHCKSGVMMYHRSVDLAQPEVMVEEKGRGDSSFFEHVLAMYDNSSMSPDTDAPTEEEPEELPQKNNNAYPIVFIHGLGIGFAHYIYLIAGLPRDRDVYLVEMPYVCMRLDAVAPNMADTVSAIVEILTADGYAGPHSPSDISEVSIRTPSKQGTNQGGRYSLRSSSKDKKQSSGVHTVLGAAAQQSEANGTSVEKRIGACFVAHSLGTCVVSWMLHHKKTRSLVATTVLIDPVTFLLCMPKVCASFVHPDPKSVSTYVSSFMLAKELYIANALSRHFNWSHNAIFLENLPGAWEKEVFDDSKEDCAMPRFEILEPEFTARKLRSTVILSKDDHIVPLENVCSYFQKKALGIYERAYGNATGNQPRPEKPRSEMVSDDAKMDMLDFCKQGNVANLPSPRPPAPVYRGRTESFNDDNKSSLLKGKTLVSPPACWFEWTVFDCAHGEQMMVPKFLQIISDKISERSEYFD